MSRAAAGAPEARRREEGASRAEDGGEDVPLPNAYFWRQMRREHPALRNGVLAAVARRRWDALGARERRRHEDAVRARHARHAAAYAARLRAPARRADDARQPTAFHRALVTTVCAACRRVVDGGDPGGAARGRDEDGCRAPFHKRCLRCRCRRPEGEGG